MAKYTYSVQNDFPHHKVDNARLHYEVQKSKIKVALGGVSVTEDVCDVMFNGDLDSTDQDRLDEVVSKHDGTPLPGPKVDKDGIPITVDKAAESDGRQIVAVSPAGVGWKTWFTGAGDSPTEGRGMGTPMRVEFDGTETFPCTKTGGFGFLELVAIHDGQVNWGPPEVWSYEDRFHLGAHIPANTPVPNGSNTGNVNLYPLGPGMNLLVPAAGNGTHDIELATAVPTPCAEGGYWNIDENTGVITPGDGTTLWQMYDFPLDVWLARSVYMGNYMCVWDIDVYRVEWWHPRWVFNIVVDKVTPGAGWIGGWLYIFRRNVM